MTNVQIPMNNVFGGPYFFVGHWDLVIRTQWLGEEAAQLGRLGTGRLGSSASFEVARFSLRRPH